MAIVTSNSILAQHPQHQSDEENNNSANTLGGEERGNAHEFLASSPPISLRPTLTSSGCAVGELGRLHVVQQHGPSSAKMRMRMRTDEDEGFSLSSSSLLSRVLFSELCTQESRQLFGSSEPRPARRPLTLGSVHKKRSQNFELF